MKRGVGGGKEKAEEAVEHSQIYYRLSLCKNLIPTNDLKRQSKLLGGGFRAVKTKRFYLLFAVVRKMLQLNIYFSGVFLFFFIFIFILTFLKKKKISRKSIPSERYAFLKKLFFIHPDMYFNKQ